MSYTKTQWVNNTTPINDTNLNKIEQGIYDNSIVVDAVTNTLNPTDTETYKTAELTEGQITNVIGVGDVELKGQTGQDGTPTPSAPVDVNVVSGSNVISTSNKNLLNLTNGIYSHNGVTAVVHKGNITLNGTASGTSAIDIPINVTLKANQSYTLQANNTSVIGQSGTAASYACIRFRKSNVDDAVSDVRFNPINNYTTFQKTEETTYAYLRVRTGDGLIYNNFIIKPQFEQGSVATTYKSHQGRNLHLDLPVENLLNLTGVPSNTTREVTLTNLGNNMFKVSALGNRTQNWIYNYSMSIPSEWLGKTLTLSAKILSGTFGSTTNIGFKSSTGDVFVSLLNSSNTTTITQSMIDSAINFQFFSSNRDFVDAIIGIQIEEGSKANAYTPYGTEPMELCKIEDYQDYFYKSGSKWYLHKEIGKAIFDGSEAWSYSSGNAVFYTDLLVTLSKPNTILFCDRFKKVANTTSYANMNTGEIKYDGAGSRRIIIKYTDITSAADFKTWLASNNTKVYYPLETATNTEITNTTLIFQLEAIYNAPLYEQTNITQTNNDLPMVLDITACKDNINGIKAFIRK